MNALLKWRKAQNLLQSELAERMFTTTSTISRIERNEAWPDASTARRIIIATKGEVTPNDLLQTHGNKGNE